VGQTIASGLSALGHDVVVGTRDAKKLDAWIQKAGPRAQVGTFADAAQADMVFLCTSWSGTESAIALAGKEHFSGKTVVDVTNPLDFSAGPPPKLAVQYPMSGGETLQNALPSAKVVKAFNIVTAKYMIDARLQAGVLDLFIAGNDAEAKGQVAEIAKAWHWGSVNDLGGIGQSYWIECFAMLWIQQGFKTGTWTHGFKLLPG